ncbi:MAG: cyclophilin-like fold protein, partial [Acetatifactor sp.]
FNGVEKISYLTEELPTEGEPDGCDPDVGDLCLYAPWGNLSVFYQDFRYSNSLILLGHIDSGMDVISGMNGDFSATLEAVD